MKLKAFEADYSCGHFAPKNFKIGSVVKKLSPKNRGVGVKLSDTVYYTICNKGAFLTSIALIEH